MRKRACCFTGKQKKNNSSNLLFRGFIFLLGGGHIFFIFNKEVSMNIHIKMERSILFRSKDPFQLREVKTVLWLYIYELRYLYINSIIYKSKGCLKAFKVHFNCIKSFVVKRISTRQPF